MHALFFINLPVVHLNPNWGRPPPPQWTVEHCTGKRGFFYTNWGWAFSTPMPRVTHSPVAHKCHVISALLQLDTQKVWFSYNGGVIPPSRSNLWYPHHWNQTEISKYCVTTRNGICSTVLFQFYFNCATSMHYSPKKGCKSGRVVAGLCMRKLYLSSCRYCWLTLFRVAKLTFAANCACLFFTSITVTIVKMYRQKLRYHCRALGLSI